MPERAQRLVVVLYEHPLLGEGIARILLVETGAEVAVAPAGDRCAMEAALARDPSVVIFERGGRELDWARLAPHAVLIDVTSATSTGTDVSAVTADLEGIILAVRGGDAGPRPVDAECPGPPQQ